MNKCADTVICFRSKLYYTSLENMSEDQILDMDGLEAIRRIRKLDRADAENIPIFAMTANAFTEDVQKSLESGATEHLMKPLDIEKVKRSIQIALNNSKNK